MRPFLCGVKQRTERSIFDGARCNTKQYLLRSNATACPLQIFTVTFPEAKKDFWNRYKDHATVIFRTCAFQVSMHTPDIPMRYPKFFLVFLQSEPASHPAPDPHPHMKLDSQRLLPQLPSDVCSVAFMAALRSVSGSCKDCSQAGAIECHVAVSSCNVEPVTAAQLQKKRSRNTETLNTAVILWYHTWSCILHREILGSFGNFWLDSSMSDSGILAMVKMYHKTIHLHDLWQSATRSDMPSRQVSSACSPLTEAESFLPWRNTSGRSKRYHSDHGSSPKKTSCSLLVMGQVLEERKPNHDTSRSWRTSHVLMSRFSGNFVEPCHVQYQRFRNHDTCSPWISLDFVRSWFLAAWKTRCSRSRK